ncbi:MAG: mechanosensitive ion channel [Paludibacteraceae bacterium]|nr:mechanosensitive ion channel [Paludibacteraceae bacterium]
MSDTLNSVADTMSVADKAQAILTSNSVSADSLNDAKDFLFSKALDWCSDLGIRILICILIYIIGSWIIKKINKIFAHVLEKREVEASLSSFLKSLVSVVLNFILILSIIAKLGIEITTFVALFASAGVAIGMALSGTLQNFAGGVMILLFKPFKVGDFIEAQGQMGVVKEIQIFNTLITTVDNKIIIIPNGGLSTGTMINYSKEPLRRVDFSFGVAYGTDYDQAKAVLEEVIAANDLILKDPEHFIALGNLGESSVDITVRVWTKGENYWSVFFKMNEDVYKAFNAKNISIPFPQVDVHMVK